MSSCSSLKCSDICRCIQLTSINGNIIIDKDSCHWDFAIDPDLLTDITATFSDSTRQFCILDKGIVKQCLTIPDSDDQYLELNGTDLSIVKPDGTTVNTVSLAGLIPVETPFALTSLSLVVTPGGAFGHSPNIELVPSSDVNNNLIIGSDGRPFVPILTQKDVLIGSNNCLSFSKVVTSGAITFTPHVDYSCLAAALCPICCAPPAIFIEAIQSNSFKLYVTNLAAGDTYDVSINGGTNYIYTTQTVSPLTVAGLTDNTTYHLIVRHNCASGGTAVTNVQLINTPVIFTCGTVTNIILTYGSYDFVTGTYPVTLTWTPITGAMSYTVTDLASSILITTTSNTVTFNISPSTSFGGTIQTNCGAGGTSTPATYTGSTPVQATCPLPTNLTVNIS